MVFDTNTLLASLDLFVVLVESKKWTCVVPLAGQLPRLAAYHLTSCAVMTELDGLTSSSSSTLATSALQASTYLSTTIKSHSLSLKIQTSKGNYLSNLSIRHEALSFTDKERSMDDIILSSATYQLSHFSNRLPLLNPSLAHKIGYHHSDEGEVIPLKGKSKVVLVTFDGNLRLKALARGVGVLGRKELEALVNGWKNSENG